MTRRLALLEVPFNSSGTGDGVARMPGVLRRAGLAERLRRLGDVSRMRVTFETPQPIRGRSGLLCEEPLVSMIGNLASAIDSVVADLRWPLVIGGDCSVLLGILRSDLDETGLLFLDGHEDAWPPLISPTGEAADCELGIALGLFPGPPGTAFTPIDGWRVAVLGPRDQDELTEAGVASVRKLVGMYVGSDLAHAEPTDLGQRVGAHLQESGRGWWLHVDLDVLSSEALPAVDYPQPGGFSWDQLVQLTNGALSKGNCVGASVVIYNPDLDGGAAAGRVVDFIEEVVASAST